MWNYQAEHSVLILNDHEKVMQVPDGKMGDRNVFTQLAHMFNIRLFKTV